MFDPLHPLTVAVGGSWSGALLWLDTLPASVGLTLVVGIGAVLGIHLEVAVRQRRREATEARA